MKLITICIPTFNQSKFLKRLLNQLTKYNPTNPIIISDNCSEDDTNKIVNSFKKKLKNLRYTRLKKNYGFDYNYQNCIKKVKTRYFWTIGSDDQIFSHSLKYIENLIKDLNYPDGITFLNKKKNNKNNLKRNIIKFDLFKHSNLLGNITLNIAQKKIYKIKTKVKKNFGYIQLYFAIKSIIKNNNWFLILTNDIAKIEYFSLDKSNNKKNLDRLNKEIKGYNLHINKLFKNQKNLKNYRDLIFKKNIRTWIFQNLENSSKKEKIIETLNKNSIFLDASYQYKLIKISINLLPLLIIKKIIYLKRIIFN